MRRDTVTQVIVDYGDFEENFATPYEAQQFITAYEDEYGLPRAAWLEDMSGHKKWDYKVFEDDSGAFGNPDMKKGRSILNCSPNLGLVK